MPRVVHFEIQADNLDRAMTFYRDLFGWTFTSFPEMDYWLVVTGPDGQPGINGGMHRRLCSGPLDSPVVTAFVCTVEVENLDELLDVIPTRGGQIALPKHAIPGIGWLAYAKDTEGNIFGMLQPATNAQ